MMPQSRLHFFAIKNGKVVLYSVGSYKRLLGTLRRRKKLIPKTKIRHIKKLAKIRAFKMGECLEYLVQTNWPIGCISVPASSTTITFSDTELTPPMMRM